MPFSPPPKVLVSGAFATGKTTLVKRMASSFESRGTRVLKTKDVARSCPFPLNKGQNPGVSMWLVGEQIRQEVSACLRGAELVICDRGMPDILSHTMVLDVRTPTDELYASLTTQMARLWVPTYDVILWATIDETREIVADRLREVDREYQRLLEDAIANVFDQLLITPVILPKSFDSRMELAGKTIEEILRLRGSGERSHVRSD